MSCLRSKPRQIHPTKNHQRKPSAPRKDMHDNYYNGRQMDTLKIRRTILILWFGLFNFVFRALFANPVMRPDHKWDLVNPSWQPRDDTYSRAFCSWLIGAPIGSVTSPALFWKLWQIDRLTNRPTDRPTNQLTDRRHGEATFLIRIWLQKGAKLESGGKERDREIKKKERVKGR